MDGMSGSQRSRRLRGAQGGLHKRPSGRWCRGAGGPASLVSTNNVASNHLLAHQTGDRGCMPPLKLAIVGAGPSAFYVASRLLSLLPPQATPQPSSLKIHMYDRLWAPYGLVRYGVAPDHPEVKVRRSSYFFSVLPDCVQNECLRESSCTT